MMGSNLDTWLQSMLGIIRIPMFETELRVC